MFDEVVQGQTVSKEEYKAAEPELRVDLINAQFDLMKVDFPVILLVNGAPSSSCDEIVDLMHEWMDARYMTTHVFEKPSDEERERPRFWRYWRAMPRHGQLGIFIGAWTLGTLADRFFRRVGDKGFSRRIGHVRRFERMLVDDGALVLKVWIHMPRTSLKKKLRKRGEKRDWRIYEEYDRVMPLAERYVRETSTSAAPWQIVDGTDKRHRNLTVAKLVRDAIRARLATPHQPAAVAAIPAPGDALAQVDLGATLEEAEYRERLGTAQEKLVKLVRKARKRGLASVLAFEGWDAAGKGGVVRRMTGPLNARDYRVLPVAAPTDEEKRHHYLWRFWRHLPRAGHMLMFDRTWYGRVLVERVEGFAAEGEWRRAYEEINDFEAQIVERGYPLLKFWLHVDKDEQLLRFQAREQTPYKKYKITDEDYRNREKWDDYVAAVDEMVARTSTDVAPWHLIPANDKRFARVTVIETVCARLRRALS